MRYHLALSLIRLLSWLPLPLLYHLAPLPAAILYWLPWRKHRVIRANLEIAFPELDPSERAQLHRAHLVEMMRLVLESGAIWHWPAAKLERHIQVMHGWDQVEAAQAAGRGVLLIGGHFGNWELSALLVSLRAPFSGLYKPPRSSRVDAALTRSRARFGARLIATGSPAMRIMLRELNQGGIVGLLMDQLPRQGEGVHAPFFGQPALSMRLVQRLAQRTGCATILTTCIRLPGGRGWSLRFETLPDTISGSDAVASATAMNRPLEQHIRSHPAQYLWLYKRFALPPEGVADPYLNPPSL